MKHAIDYHAKKVCMDRMERERVNAKDEGYAMTLTAEIAKMQDELQVIVYEFIQHWGNLMSSMKAYEFAHDDERGIAFYDAVIASQQVHAPLIDLTGQGK